MTSLESGYHKWVCFDHSHPHIFKNDKCLNCGMKKCQKDYYNCPHFYDENLDGLCGIDNVPCFKMMEIWEGDR